MLNMVDRMRLAAAVLVVLVAGVCASAQPRTLYEKKSEFNEIIVTEDSSGVRHLIFEKDGATQTSVDTKAPYRLVLSYARCAMTGLAIVPKPERILMVGLGGGAMPMYLRHNFPEAKIDVAELDPAVAEVATKFFGFKEDAAMKVHVGDGRAFIEKTDNRYDIIFLDAFGPDSIPYSLTTREFLGAVKSKLADGGIVVANVWSARVNKMYLSMVATYRTVFDEVHIVQAPLSENRIVIAMRKRMSLTPRLLSERAAKLQSKLDAPLDLSEMIDGGYQPIMYLSQDVKVLLDADEPKK